MGADSGAVRAERHPAAGGGGAGLPGVSPAGAGAAGGLVPGAAHPAGDGAADQWLYLGPPELSLEETNGLCVEWNGLRFAVRAAQPVCVGEETLYWWALLAVEDGEAQTEQT